MANLDLSKYGITDVKEILHNPSYEVLFEEETKEGLEGYEKGQLTELDTVNVMTGIYTGRSPKDKFFVKNEASEDSVWWILKLVSIASVMPSNHLILCRPLLLLLSVFPSIRIFSNRSYLILLCSVFFFLLIYSITHLDLGDGVRGHTKADGNLFLQQGIDRA